MSGSFRFLDLPKELRLMVYELLPTVTTRDHKLSRSYSTIQRPAIIIVKTIDSQSILRTCRLIYREASPVFAKAQARLLPPEIVVHFEDVLILHLLDAKIPDRILGNRTSIHVEAGDKVARIAKRARDTGVKDIPGEVYRGIKYTLVNSSGPKKPPVLAKQEEKNRFHQVLQTFEDPWNAYWTYFPRCSTSNAHQG
ncbi:hypothetical protein BDV96DRAFT_646641 [Lophiotrema nucula]|uniref:F-box domain-containing protein n=1 Tax=Lophiotrema nucula TaxID=690887 RepID=A0A6A5Z6I9_9PLEO|nr:hypothetical protein BDV96DRAFT_646641 [Lophiotrema nucula]